MKVSYEDVIKNEQIAIFIEKADMTLAQLGYTEHSFIHAGRVTQVAGMILEELMFSKRDIELAKIAGYMHDIGNVINRTDHAQSGAVMAYRLRDNMGMEAGDIADSGRTSHELCDSTTFDQHDRVNFAVKESKVKVENKKRIVVKIKLDKKICSVMDYFEIFLDRMILCRKAAEKLCVEFCLVINKERVI